MKNKENEQFVVQEYSQYRPHFVNNATLSIFTSSGRRELVERWELFLYVDFSSDTKIVSAELEMFEIIKQTWNIKYGSQFNMASFKCLNSHLRFNERFLQKLVKSRCKLCLLLLTAVFRYFLSETSSKKSHKIEFWMFICVYIRRWWIQKVPGLYAVCR